MNLHPQHAEALRDINPDVANIIRIHESQKPEWFPTELIPENWKGTKLPPELAAGLTLNLLTEDGLPYFLSLLVTHLGDEGPLFEWNKLWTSEEKLHGTAIQLYLYECLGREERIRVERMEKQYLRVGFWPDWSRDPFKLLAYVVLQERATQFSHAAIARKAASVDPVLRTLMSKIAGDESRHHDAYVSMFGALLKRDPSHAVTALHSVIKYFKMPGAGVDGFQALSQIQERSGMFGAKEFRYIIVEACDKLGIWELTGLSGDAEKAREDIQKTIKLLERVDERNQRQAKKEIPITFLDGNISILL